MKNKDVYLIITHNVDYTFNSLLELLDNENNDIFIHMDKKTKELDIEYIKSIVNKSKIYFIDRTRCNWGGFSLVRAELTLLKEASKNNYRYYHLLSGQDLPIKNQNEIYNFFTNNYGKQFIGLQNEKFQHDENIKYYYPFQETLGRKSFKSIYGKIINKLSKIIQNIFKINRNKNISFQKGDQWFSITDELVKHILENEDKYTKIFKSTYCPDEMFIQTIVINSKFKNIVYSYDYNSPKKSIKRLIDWNRGNPYVWRSEDFKELVESDALFARKFDSNIDKEIIDKIKEYVSK